VAKDVVEVPAKTGPIICFQVDDMDAALRRAREWGGATLYEKKAAPGGFVAECAGSASNRIALFASAK
jgi:predicted enzyme related to lactoylglutathione lyase